MDDEQAVLLRRVILRLARSFNSSATDEDLTPTQASVLGVVAGRGPVLLAEVARVENLNPSMASRVIGALDERGLIERTPDPNDLRAATLAVTEMGRAVHRRIKERRAAVIRSSAERLTPEEHEALVQALPALESLARLIG